MLLVCCPANSVAIRKPAISSLFVARPAEDRGGAHPSGTIILTASAQCVPHLQMHSKPLPVVRRLVSRADKPQSPQYDAADERCCGQRGVSTIVDGAVAGVDEGLQHIVALLPRRPPPLDHLVEQARQLGARPAPAEPPFLTFRSCLVAE